MSLVWFTQSNGSSPAQEEIMALSWDWGEYLALKLFQITRDAEACAHNDNWFDIKTNIKVTAIAWSDILWAVIYIFERRGYYCTFSWDQIDVIVLSLGRCRDKASKIHAIELALRRFEHNKHVTSAAANWRQTKR
jgi:hypothetical protein